MTSELARKLRDAVAILGAALAIPALAQDTVSATRGAAPISTEALAKYALAPARAAGPTGPKAVRMTADFA